MEQMLPLGSWATLFDHEIDDIPSLIRMSVGQGLSGERTDGKLWVFWRQEDDDPSSSLRKKIKDGLPGFIHHGFIGVLVQFWAPMTIGGRRFLKTSNQPFGLSRINGGLCKYRKHCMRHDISLEGGSEEELGVPGRVFRNKCVESTPFVSYYSTKEYPHRDIAVNCDIHESVAVPMFEPPGQCCVGVLELVASCSGPEVPALCCGAFGILEAINLKSSWRFCNQVEEDVKHTMDEIEKKLGKVCTTHKLPLAQTWIPCRPSSVVSYGDSQETSFSSSDYLTVWEKTVLDDNSYSRAKMLGFNKVCRYHNFRKGQGLVGKALLSHKLFFCEDITQLPINEYPIAHHVRHLWLTGCFVICLRDSSSNQDYVLEFFLPSSTDDIDTKDLQDFLDKLLATIKKHFQRFKVASGKELGEELSVQVVKFSMNDESDSFKICQATKPPPEALENEREAVAVTHTITNATPIQDVRTVTVKATYGDDIFRFQLPFSSKMADLVEKVNIRVPLKDVPLSIKYEDEDGDWVSIACDEDLEECMGSSRSLGKTPTIKILVKPITNQAP